MNADFWPTLVGTRSKAHVCALGTTRFAGLRVARSMTLLATKDPLGRLLAEAVLRFLEACRPRLFQSDSCLEPLPDAGRGRAGSASPQLAAQLEDLLDAHAARYPARSGRDPEGDTADGLSASRDRLATFEVDGQALELQLERVELRPGYHVWLVASDSLPLIPKAHQLVAETAFEKKLPQVLVTLEILRHP